MAVLGLPVTRWPTCEEVTKQARIRFLEIHPDKHGGVAQGNISIDEVVHARDELLGLLR